MAHGSGSADRESVDRSDRVRVPPEDPAYTLRRVWLSESEEQGFYYGLSNEGLWPLCHLAYVRPTFRGEDWVVYQSVNRKFADVVAREAQSDDPIILIQDFHFAMLPGYLRARRPSELRGRQRARWTNYSWAVRYFHAKPAGSSNSFLLG